MTVVAWHSARRRLTSPALVIPPETSRSPDWFREGVRPTHGPTFIRGREPGGVMDSGSIGQCHDSANPWHRHQSATDRIFVGELADMSFKARQHSPQRRPRRPRAEHGFGCRFQHRIEYREVADRLFEPAT